MCNLHVSKCLNIQIEPTKYQVNRVTPMNIPEKKLILLVDDTPDNIDVISGILRDEFKVKVALNGKRALKIVGSDQKPDLILLDIMMPEMDGFEVCRILKDDNETKDIPVIFVTAKTETVDEKEGFELGAADYITKPIKPEILQVRIRTQLALVAAQREADRLLEENKDMLDQTLVGSMFAISNLLSWANPAAFLRAARLRMFMEGMVEELECLPNDRWQLNLAATLSQIGMVSLPADEMEKYAIGKGVSVKFLNLFKGQAEIGGRVLAQVPRLENVAKIIENQLQPLPAQREYSEPINERDTFTIGWQLLKTLTDFDHKLLGEKSSVVLKNMANNHLYDPLIIAALEKVIKKMEWIPCALAVTKLTSEMVLDEDIIFSGDIKKIEKGTALNQQIIDQISALFSSEQHYRLFRVKVPFKVDENGNLPSAKEMQALVSTTTETDDEIATGVDGKIDLVVVEELLKELVSLLKDDDPGAKDIVANLQEKVVGTAVAEQFEKIQTLIGQYEFPEALELVNVMTDTLKIELE
jgi:CheY-like chemotaxis protein